MKGLEIEYSFIPSRIVRGWCGPVCETLYLQHMDEATFSVKEADDLPQTFPIDDQSRALQLYLRERVGGRLRIDLRMPYTKLLRAAPHLQLLGVLVSD